MTKTITLNEATIINTLDLAIGDDAFSPMSILALGSRQGISITGEEAASIAVYMLDNLA